MVKNILITGSTDGIGKLVAAMFAKEGHTVYVHGRSQEKVNATISELKGLTKNESIHGFVADLSDLDAVKKMVLQVNDEVSHIDILINNAGVFKTPFSVNRNGLDLRFVVNYLAPYLLTKGLTPLIKKGSNARIINLSSAAQAPVSYDAIVGKKEVSVNEFYAISKLALTMWSFRLAKELEDIAVIAVNPGSLLNTKMANEAYGQHWSPANKGSNILYDLAVSEDHKGITGKYFDNDNGVYAKAHPDAYNETAINELIDFTNKLID
ncbi:SDR family NAD(P)-dependent oxidoreductase [Labilibaculum sp. DW002]|uniref:SDR family NAD(P)-dependent oxidoreductase n=1 Tax=Paralabilibaculum antarcticum TaxID=2912572 RepID=A0ABT5VR49_9BACT|nr:SDR family NAD(P)-dependent oxidoreductase [Labilibaculum sp. DW002]MDE5417896.1 SDR family NAD(P)-dependent oxidoreductase [Labilibaculum sp. DW002]